MAHGSEIFKNIAEGLAILIGGIWLMVSFSADKPLLPFLASGHLDLTASLEPHGLLSVGNKGEAIKINLEVKNTGKKTMQSLNGLVRIWGIKLHANNVDSDQETPEGVARLEHDLFAGFVNDQLKSGNHGTGYYHYRVDSSQLVAVKQVFHDWVFEPNEVIKQAISVYVPCGVYDELEVMLEIMAIDGVSDEWSVQWELDDAVNSRDVFPYLVSTDPSKSHVKVPISSVKKTQINNSSAQNMNEIENMEKTLEKVNPVNYYVTDNLPLSDRKEDECPSA